MQHSRFLTRTIGPLLTMLSITMPGMAQSTAPGDEAPKPVHVYILSGQSNMVGSGTVSELSPDWQKPIDGAMIFQKGKFVRVNAGEQKNFGPELGFAHYLRSNQPGRPEIYLIKFAISGQPLDAGWDGANWAGEEPGVGRKTFFPGDTADCSCIGLHYQKLNAYTKNAMKALRDAGKTPVLQGIVWMQGEADAKHEISAGRYDQTLALLKKRLEADFADGKNVPFVFGQVLPHDPPLDRFTHRDLIRQRMAEADCRSGSERAVNNIWMVSTDGMELKKDTVHYSTKGNLALGQAFGLEMLKAHRQAKDDAKK